MADPDLQMLIDARERSRRLLASLRQKRDELAAGPPALDPEKLRQGREAMDNAVAAAERTLSSLEAALALALRSRQDDATASN